MNIFKQLIDRFTPTTPIREGGRWWFPINMLSGDNSMEQYLKVPELVNVWSIRARAMASGYMDVISTTTDLPAKNNQSLVRILRNPNYFQSYSEFWRQSDIFRSMYGNEYLYFLRPVGMSNTYKGMFTLNPANVMIDDKSDGLFFLESQLSDKIEYKYKMKNGQLMPLDRNNIIHLNDNRFSTDSGLFGTSKIKSLAPALDNILKAYRKRGIMLDLPPGIFRPNAKDDLGFIPFDPKEKTDHENALQMKQGFPIVTNLATTYESMAGDPRAQGLFDEIKRDTETICDAYGVPFEVLANEKGVTYTNLKEAKKQMYEEMVMPEMQERVDALNMSLDMVGRGQEIRNFWNHLPVFAEDKKANAQTYNTYVMGLSRAFQDGALTLQEYQEKLKNI